VIFFNVSEGCQIFVDGEKYVPTGEEYAPFSTGTLTSISSFKIATIFHLGESYSFWFDDYFMSEIKSGFQLNIYNRFIYLDNLKYSFDEETKKSFENFELFSFPTPGLHNITIYGTDSYDVEYQSEFQIFTTDKTVDFYNITEFHEMPTQWSDYSFTYGSSSQTGSTEDNDNVYASIEAEAIAGSESSVYSDPVSDAGNTGWYTAPLEPKIDDGIRYPTTSGFSGGYISGYYNLYCYFNMGDVTIPANNYITKIQVWMYCRTTDPEWWELMMVDIRFSGYTGWIYDKEIGQTGWSWDSCTWNFEPGVYSDIHADALQVKILTMKIVTDDTIWNVEAMYAQIFYAPVTYRITTEITTTIPSENLDKIKTLYYDYATTTSLDCDLDIWNYNAGNWNTELESNTQTSYITDSFNLTDDYISESNEIKIRFETTTTANNFDIQIDQLMITYDIGIKKEL